MLVNAEQIPFRPDASINQWDPAFRFSPYMLFSYLLYNERHLIQFTTFLCRVSSSPMFKFFSQDLQSEDPGALWYSRTSYNACRYAEECSTSCMREGTNVMVH